MTIHKTSLKLRKIASILIKDKLAHLSFKFNEYEYLGDPLIILFVLSNLCVDEVSIFDLDASQSGNLNQYLLKSMRSVADYPLSYAGGIRSINQIDYIFGIGYDRLIFSCQNPRLREFVAYTSSKYGRQAVSLSVDYTETNLGRFIYNPYIRSQTNSTLADFILSAPCDLISDLLFTSITRTGTSIGIDIELISLLDSLNLRNPILLSGGLSDPSVLSTGYNSISGIVSSTSMFLQSYCKGTALVSLNRFQN